MSAEGVRVITLAFPNPESRRISSGDFHPLEPRLSYSFAERGSIRTLSTTATRPGRDIDGLLYTPLLPPNTCPEAADVIPANATTQADLPTFGDIFRVAIAPWINANCTLAYLASVDSSYTQAFVFYLLDNHRLIPPHANDPVWSLDDGGRWKSVNRFPVYAVPSFAGQEFMNNLAEYSGNITEVPNGEQLAEDWPTMSYIRLAIEIDVESTNRLPSLWVFLLIVIAIMIIIIGSTSLSMHWVQRRRREELRRRVANGDINLEALGIKRLTVPQEIIDKMPLYTYSAAPGETKGTTTDTETKQATADVESKTVSADAKATDTTTAATTVPPSNTTPNLKEVGEASSSSSSSASTTAPQPELYTAHFSQATCPICLEDYVSGETTVRELPCRHLFHPDCVDAFLLRNSSLCPICKTSTLPKGYCPAEVTNLMVRRERMAARMRDGRLEVTPLPGDGPSSSSQAQTRVREAMRSAVANGRRALSGPNGNQPGAPSTQDVELRPNTNSRSGAGAAGGTGAQPCPPSRDTSPPADQQRRREWARERAVAMLGQREGSQDLGVEAEAARIPAWRRAIGKVFPGFS